MRYQVLVTEDARRDIEELHNHIARFDSLAKADHVLDRLVEVAESLTTSPERGSFPKELLALGIREYRQVFFKPFRVIYRVTGHSVLIYLIADGRRNMHTLLARRLLAG
jgi:toxin ParE1/3/4